MNFKITEVSRDFKVHLNEDDTACIEFTVTGELDGDVWPEPCKIIIPRAYIDITLTEKENKYER